MAASEDDSEREARRAARDAVARANSAALQHSHRASLERARELEREIRRSDGPTPASRSAVPDTSLRTPEQNQKLAEAEARLKAQKTWAKVLLTLLFGLAMASTVLVFALAWQNGWELAPEIVIAYFTAVVVETIGVVLVAARYIFPNPGS